MAKKRKSTRSKKPRKPQAPQHVLPAGFWAQVSAVVLVALAILLVVTWFSAGGPVLLWLAHALMWLVGMAVYIVPLLFIYLAVEIFRSENNRVSAVVYIASLLLVAWLAAFAGLIMFEIGTGPGGGGVIGGGLDHAILMLVNKPVAVFIYLLLVLITVIFVLSITPMSVIRAVMSLFRSGDDAETEENVKIMRQAADGRQSIGELKLNPGVPTLLPDGRQLTDRKSSHLTNLRGSVPRDKVAEDQAALVAASDPDWKSPSLELLEKNESPADPGDVQQNAQVIHDTLSEFNIDVEMEGANIGPKVTQYTLRPPSGVKLTRITALETNLALNLAAQSLRIEAPIPGQRAVGIEVPNKRAADVRLHGILDSKQWKSASQSLSFAIGKDISGTAVVGELDKMPHLLIAGQTGSGKSVMINTLLTSLLYRNSPSEMKLILVDPKRVELTPYNEIPHLLTPVITEPEKTISALKWAVNEMERRYKLLAAEKMRDIASYNKKLRSGAKKISVADEEGNTQEVENGAMPYIVIVIDELADLMMVASRDVEALIVRLAAKARAVGIHLVLATQSPRADIITGMIKANIPARIAFTVAGQIESRIILDQVGAEKLLGQGDMLFLGPGMSKPKRIQGAWVMDQEVIKITDYLRMQSAPQYNDDIISQPVQLNGKGGVVMDFSSDENDDMFKDAVRVVIDSKKASTSLLQRRLRVGYARAARIMEEMEEQGIIGPADGARPREVLISSLDSLQGSDDQDEY